MRALFIVAAGLLLTCTLARGLGPYLCPGCGQWAQEGKAHVCQAR